jgi:hypothetical protein
MALGTITPISDYVIGDHRQRKFTIVGANPYTAGGDSLTPAQLGFVSLPAGADFHVAVETSVAGISGAYDYTAQKLKCFAGAAEAAGDLSGSTFHVIVTGKYSL